MARRRDLATVFAYLLVAGADLLLRVKSPFSDVLMAPLVVFVPGYAIISAVESPRHRLEGPRRILLSVTMSFAAIVLGGIGLNAIALDQTTWAVWLVAISLVGAVVAAIRDRAASAGPSPAAVPRLLTRGAVLRTVAALSLPLLCVAGAVVLTELSARHSYYTPVTQIAALPAGGPRSPLERLSITNLSASRRHYVVEVGRLGARSNRRFTISVGPSQTWAKLERRTQRVSIATVTAVGAAPRVIGEVTWTE